MDRRSATVSRRVIAWIVPVLVAATVFVAGSRTPAHALNLTANAGSDGVYLDQQTGGQPTRFQFEATEDASDTISAMTLTFPAGFDLSKASADIVTIQLPLTRVDVTSTVQISGETVSFKFDPPIAPAPKTTTDVSIYVHNVMTPSLGATYTLGVTYVSNGDTKPIPGVTFTYASPNYGQNIATWLDGQPWVKAWNSVPLFNQFLQPQLAVIAFTTVWQGWLISLALVIIAFPLAICGGLTLAFMKMSKIPPVRWVASIYINVVRGTPLFLQIAIVFVGLPIAGATIIAKQWFVAGFAVLALNSSAYLAEIFRAGIQSISKGQFEAASSLGMTYPQSMAYVIIPQTVKRVLPTMTSEFILLFKDTALLSAFGVFELLLWSNGLVSHSGDITPFMVAAVYYLIVTVPLINLVGRLEARLAQSEGGQTPVTALKRGRSWAPAAAGPASSLEASSVEHESR
jgi:His/Glu/Gln/Arg/opine family amino acid ABC transporter permease subunit